MRKADNLQPYCAVVTKSGNLTSWNPLGLSRTVMELLYLYLYVSKEWRSKRTFVNIFHTEFYPNRMNDAENLIWARN